MKLYVDARLHQIFLIDGVWCQDALRAYCWFIRCEWCWVRFHLVIGARHVGVGVSRFGRWVYSRMLSDNPGVGAGRRTLGSNVTLPVFGAHERLRAAGLAHRNPLLSTGGDGHLPPNPARATKKILLDNHMVFNPQTTKTNKQLTAHSTRTTRINVNRPLAKRCGYPLC